MAIEKVPQIYINNNGCFTPIRTALNKLNEVIDAIEGQGSDSALTVTTLTANTSVITDTITEKTANNGVTIAGLKIKNGRLQPTLSNVTQTSSPVTAVTTTGTYGIITTVSESLVAGTGQVAFTFNNSNITTSNLVRLWIQEYTGTGTVIVSNQLSSSGSVNIRLQNAHASASLNAVIKIGYEIIS